ncbi:MAG: condensation domain-containing protein [Chloroflexi bacterium]|nr:condensation domain-containing protein [Chloroflexota bacterium]
MPIPDGAAIISKTFIAPRNAIEEQLAAIWQRLLKVKQVSVQDNFFELGGDSILAIRFIGQAKEIGITFQVNQLFQNQTVEKLALLVDTQRPYPLTAVQKQLLVEEIEPTVLQLRITKSMNMDSLQKAFVLLQQQLLNLHISFSQNPEGEWQQQTANAPSDQCLEVVPLKHLTNRIDQIGAIQTTLQALKQRIGNAPPYITATYLQFPKNEMLLLAVSPLVADRASLPNLLNALVYAYQFHQLPNLQQIGWRDWVSAQPTQPDRSYWQNMAEQIEPLPAKQNCVTDPAISPQIRQRLDAAYTIKLQQIQDRYNMRLQEVVLTAVSQTITRWQKSDHVWLTTSQYHRAAAINGFNTRHTIGQLQTNVPLYLCAPTAPSADAWLQNTKTNCRQLPIVSQDDETLWSGLPQIGFVWQPTIPDTDFLSPLSVKASHGMTNPLVLIAGQIGLHLHMEWCYDPTLFQHDTILKLSQQWQQQIDQLIEQTKQVEERQLAPSDFPEAPLNQAQLTQFLNKIGQKQTTL